ncbi:helix-turn-helix domain-containing protein, partial [Staphylococcus aureus]
GRASVACQRLHIHRTTLYYRLEQMPEVVREALADGLQRSTLHLTLKLLRLWDEELRRGEPAAVTPAALPRERSAERLRA